jgi:predicted RNA-binding protein with PUA-like domain|tara:strand:- start:7838 stop:8104 length:267 start_codon:yes stop_codon:yes gene_type:complete
MAYASSGLTQMSMGGGNAIWFYSTTDAIATINSAGYFTGEAVNMLNVGDVIFVYDSNTPTLSIVQVNANNGTTVDITDGTTISQTDSD